MLTDQDYEIWATNLAVQCRTSPRVIRHVRNLAKIKYPGMDYFDLISAGIRDAKLEAMEIKKSSNPMILDIINTLSRRIDGLKTSNAVINKIQSDIELVKGSIDKLGYRYSIKRFLIKMTEQQFNMIIAPITEDMIEQIVYDDVEKVRDLVWKEKIS